MRPVNIVLLVLAGAMGGAVVMKVLQPPHPAQVAEVDASAAAPTPVTAPPPAAPSAEPAETEPVAPPVTSQRKIVRRRVIVPPKRVVFQHPAERRHIAPAVAPFVPKVLAQVQTPPTPASSQPAPQTPPLTPEQPKETPPGNMEPEEATPVPAPPIPAPPEPHTVTLNAGMLIPVRLVDSLSLERNHAGDYFAATLDSELDAGGFAIAERGARVEGRVVAADAVNKTLSVELTGVRTSDRQDVSIQTERFDKRSALPSQTRIAFRLRAPVTITERRD